MKVYLPRKIGFCVGVRQAIRMVEEELKKKEEIYCLGDLIHNPVVMSELASRGLKVLSDVTRIKKGTVFTRAHGVERAILEEAAKRGLRMVETTCPYVSRVQRIARNLSVQSYHIVVIGSAKHPEVRSVVSDLPTKKLSIVKTIKEIEKIPRVKKMGIVAQTTESLDNFKNIVKNLIENRLEDGLETRVFNTVCSVVRERQKETKELAGKVEAMIVVGGYKSSNTQKLAEICRNMGVRTYLIEKEEDIDLEEVKKINTVGITGGTSTPEKVIRNLEKKLSNLN
ncbi:4-hydroxy-3-methylbut-2-enyl diphosphate reductase [Candidatus Aerophobetes bacterium]|uniref:4-hydroxy-3-methylbut-2-enyl diphosphate reductase n=1 Tax=Aerophobetes bacterium TaxID=2030807 RepID=A0A662DHM7_UNCAE|nr:MAG: 4-hydroxy-3-methylbut-2-enyl diphosphate reductase [Candidatus Aerophobetes bacterium]